MCSGILSLGVDNIFAATIQEVWRAAICLVGGFLEAIVGTVAKEQFVSVDYYVIYCYFFETS